MKKTPAVIAALAVTLAAGSVGAAERGAFLGVEGAASFAHPIGLDGEDLSLNPGFVGGVVGGYDFGKVRVQGELTYRQNTVGDGAGTVSLTSLAANGLYDFTNSTAVTPFVGGGIGVGYIDFRDTSNSSNAIDDGTMVGLVQVVAGTGIKLAEKVHLDLSYRFFVSTFEVKSGGDRDTSAFLNHNVMVGLRFGL